MKTDIEIIGDLVKNTEKLNPILKKSGTTAGMYALSLRSELTDSVKELNALTKHWIALDAEGKTFEEIKPILDAECRELVGQTVEEMEEIKEMLSVKLVKARSGSMDEETYFVNDAIYKIPLNPSETYNQVSQKVHEEYCRYLDEGLDKETCMDKLTEWVNRQIEERKFQQN